MLLDVRDADLLTLDDLGVEGDIDETGATFEANARLKARAAALPSMAGLDLVPMVTSGQRFDWDETTWERGRGYGHQGTSKHHVVAIDYGVKRNILRLLAEAGCKVTVVPATAFSRSSP